MGNIVGNANPGGPWNGTSAPDGSTAVSNPDAGNTGIGTGTVSATSAATLFSVDTTGFNGMSVHVTSAGTTCTITYEISNDNTNWNSTLLIRADAVSNVTPTSTITGIFVCPLEARYFRARVSTYTSGTVTVSYAMRQTYNNIYTTTLLNGASTASVSLTAVSTGGYSYTHIAAGQATTTVKSGAGTLHSIVLNSAATATNVTTVFDSTTGSGSVIAIPAVTTATVPTTLIFDLAFATGLTILTATANGGDMTVCYK